MPITIENAVVATAVRRFHMYCGIIRFNSDDLPTALRCIWRRRLAASFISISRWSFLCNRFWSVTKATVLEEFETFFICFFFVQSNTYSCRTISWTSISIFSGSYFSYKAAAHCNRYSNGKSSGSWKFRIDFLGKFN